MPLLNFQSQFADLVEQGLKRQTIRAFRKDKRDPKPGDCLFLYTGIRTKACRKLGEAICHTTRVIRISKEPKEKPLSVHGWPFLWGEDPLSQYDTFAQADGFANTQEMLAWFENIHGLPFSGLVIYWGDLL